MNPVQGAAHRANSNSQEHGRSQQLGNDKCERHTQNDCERRKSQIAEMTPVQMVTHRSQGNGQEHGRVQQMVTDNRERRTKYETV